jgi:glycosyltransferase involved in cell wall biosynthesis
VEVSIITVNYNNASGLEETLKSVSSQSYKNLEYIIIDGGSTDESINVIKKYNSQISSWISESDRGIYDAMNKGIEKASGKYLMFLNSGDILLETDTLKNSLSTLSQMPSVDIFYGDILVANDRRVSHKWIKAYPKKIDLDFLRRDTLNHQASFIKSNLFQEFSLYPEKYKLASDYWLYLKCLLNDKKFYHLNFPIVEYDLGGVSGMNYDAYLREKQIVWQELVAGCIQQVIDERDNFKRMTRGKIMQTTLKVNAKFQAFKNKFL